MLVTLWIFVSSAQKMKMPITKNRYLRKITWFWIEARCHHGHTITLLPDISADENVRVWRRESFIAGPPKNSWLMPQQTPNSWRVSAKHLTGKVREGFGELLQTSWYGNSLSLQLSIRSGHDVPVNLQQDKYYSLLCNFFISIWIENIISLRVRVLRMGYPVYFRKEATFF